MYTSGIMFGSDEGATKSYGITSPISTAGPTQRDLDLSQKLEECMKAYDVFEDATGMAKIHGVLGKIKQLLIQWIKEVGIDKNMPKSLVDQCGGEMYTFGSYRLGVHTKGATVDALCVAPRHVDRSKFFSSFYELLKVQPEVKHLRAVKEAYVPVIKMTFDGVKLNMVFGRLALKIIPPNQDLHDESILKNLDIKCIRSLNGRRTTDEILNLVPNVPSFRMSLRAVKLWAKKRGIYSNSLGYLGGVSWAMLMARVCQLYPNATAGTLLQKFFLVFSKWEWPQPVLLTHMPEHNSMDLPVWDPRVNTADRFDRMPIITPVYPQQNSTFNVTNSTRAIMVEEIKEGLRIIDSIIEGKTDWNALFECSDFFSKYTYYIVLKASANCEELHLEWSELVESKLRILVGNLERNPYVTLAHLNPHPIGPKDEDNEKYFTKWFIGLNYDNWEPVDTSFDLANFRDSVTRQALTSGMLKGCMKIDIENTEQEKLGEHLPESFVKSLNLQEKLKPLLEMLLTHGLEYTLKNYE